jgi:hypothetical protein
MMKEAHIGVSHPIMKIAPGCAAFLRDAVAIYCKA